MATPPFRETLSLTVKDILRRLGFQADVKTGELALDEGKVSFHCEITLQEGQNLLIGQHGANIAALLHLIRLLARKDQPENAVLSLDVNGYFQGKKVYLEREALQAAKEAEETGLPVMLRPMLSFERKLVHMSLATHPKVITESIGRGEERRVLVKRRPEESEEGAGLGPE